MVLIGVSAGCVGNAASNDCIYMCIFAFILFFKRISCSPSRRLVLAVSVGCVQTICVLSGLCTVGPNCTLGCDVPCSS